MKKILIIEDEPDVADTMKMLIEREGYKVDYVLDPVEGLKKMKKYDLILLDIMMPKLSGREVMAEIEKRKIKVPVIVVSAVGLPAEMERELNVKHPDVGFVAKTHMHDDLLKQIKKKIGK